MYADCALEDLKRQQYRNQQEADDPKDQAMQRLSTEQEEDFDDDNMMRHEDGAEVEHELVDEDSFDCNGDLSDQHSKSLM